MSENNGWIGVDLDGTLAVYDGWKGSEHIGEPIPKMLDRVVAWINNGQVVKIFTARVSSTNPEANINRAAIHAWLAKHVYPKLPKLDDSLAYYIQLTAEKDYNMIALWDDRCVQVEPNTGNRVDGKEE